MEKVEAGLLKSILDAIKKLSEHLFNYLGSSDFEKENIKIDEKSIKKLNEETFEVKMAYVTESGAEVVYTTKVKLDHDNDIADIEVIYKDGTTTKTASKKAVKGDDYPAESKKLLFTLLDDDTKKAFGIKSSKTLKVTLQRITAAKETSINLTAIKANYELREAYSDLDELLDSPEFIDEITEEPVSFEIVDLGEGFDVNPIDIQQEECTIYSLQQLLCAAIQFNMDIQQLRWESVRSEHLFRVMGNALYDSQNWVDKLGLWIIEKSNSVCNLLGSCKPDLGENVDISSDHSPCMEYIGMQYVFPVFDRIINTIEWNFPNLPSDMQQELNWWLRNLKQTRDIDLKQM